MEPTPGRGPEHSLHAASIERSVQELQRQIREQEETLAQLRASSADLENGSGQSATASMDMMRKAYDNVAASEPFLPFPDSVLPALLALRKTQSTIEESREYLKSQEVTLDQARRRLEVEQANLDDQNVLTKAIEDRIESLRQGAELRRQKSPRQAGKEKMDELAKQKREYDKETSKLLKALIKFIDNELGAMLAAEDLGGPVVGDMMDIDSDDLAAGFNAQGRPKKAKADANQDKTQRRLDEIWGSAQDGGAARAKGKGGEASAAGAEMRELTEKLLNTVMNSGGDSSAAYVTIERESAAARFLVRSKVAQFHPKDSTMLRLVDFGRRLTIEAKPLDEAEYVLHPLEPPNIP